jgi:hypothetical protein
VCFFARNQVLLNASMNSSFGNDDGIDTTFSRRFPNNIALEHDVQTFTVGNNIFSHSFATPLGQSIDWIYSLIYDGVVGADFSFLSFRYHAEIF